VIVNNIKIHYLAGRGYYNMGGGGEGVRESNGRG
jgi:hypothetical protein